MEELISGFDNFKVSALSKSKHLNSYITNVTLGPNSTILQEEETTTEDDTDTKTVPQNNVVTSTVPNTSVLNRLLAEIEKQRQKKVQEAINSHFNNILEFTEKQKLNAKQQYERRQQMLINGMQQQEILILQALEQYDKDVSLEHQQLVQYYQELAEKRKKNDQELEEKEKQRQQINLIIDGIKKDQVEFRNVYQEIINVIKGCKHQSQLKLALGDAPKQLKVLPEGMEEIIIRCKAGKISENEIRKSNELVGQMKELLELIKQKVAEVAIQQTPVEKPKPTVTTAAVPIAPIVAPPSQEQVKLNTKEETASKAPVVTSSAQLNKFISTSSLTIYLQLYEFLDQYTKSYKELLEDNSYKQFRFDCKKAVNIPVNSISAVNAHHLLDKYNRLSNLLSGKVVEVGGVTVCASKHPQGLAFCTNLLAKKFVLQGDLMISSNPEAAFAYAAITTTLWNDFPNFGKLLLAHLYQQCPYLVPFYPPRTTGQTDEEYYSSLGYQYNDGVVEKQDKFLKRMTGIMRLYSAIVVQKPRRGQQKNPHGLVDGWKWLTSFLNLEPKPDITATMLHVFLENAGSTFQTTYGKTFRKLMVYVQRIYLPMIQKIDSGGPVTRLEVLFQDYEKDGYFKTPHGLLPINFW